MDLLVRMELKQSNQTNYYGHFDWSKNVGNTFSQEKIFPDFYEKLNPLKKEVYVVFRVTFFQRNRAVIPKLQRIIG